MYVCVYVHVQKRQNVLEHKEDEKKRRGNQDKEGKPSRHSSPGSSVKLLYRGELLTHTKGFSFSPSLSMSHRRKFLL